MIDMSLSTRKPRPTKQQKLMAQLGITNPEELPVHLRPKPPGSKKKEKEDGSKKGSENGGNVPTSLQSHTPPGLPHGVANKPVTFHNTLSTGAPGTQAQDVPATFSYDAMNASTTYPELNSPMFTTASAMARPDLASPQAHGIDPQLDNMFGRPSSSGNGQSHDDDAGFGFASPPLPTQGATGHEERSDPIDLFGSLTNEPEQDADSQPFGEVFGPQVGAFEDSMDTTFD